MSTKDWWGGGQHHQLATAAEWEKRVLNVESTSVVLPSISACLEFEVTRALACRVDDPELPDLLAAINKLTGDALLRLSARGKAHNVSGGEPSDVWK